MDEGIASKIKRKAGKLRGELLPEQKTILSITTFLRKRKSLSLMLWLLSTKSTSKNQRSNRAQIFLKCLLTEYWMNHLDTMKSE